MGGGRHCASLAHPSAAAHPLGSPPGPPLLRQPYLFVATSPPPLSALTGDRPRPLAFLDRLTAAPFVPNPVDTPVSSTPLVSRSLLKLLSPYGSPASPFRSPAAFSRAHVSLAGSSLSACLSMQVPPTSLGFSSRVRWRPLAGSPPLLLCIVYISATPILCLCSQISPLSHLRRILY